MGSSVFGQPLSRRGLLKAGAGAAALAGLVPVLNACGSSGGASGDSNVLNVAFFGTQSEAEKAQRAAAPFEAAHPGTKVKFTATNGNDWNDFFSKLLTQIAGGNVPDIATVATEGLQLFAAKGLAAPLDDYVKRDAAELKEFFADVHPSLVESMMYQGHLYELPTDFNAGNLYYNTDLFTHAGIERPSDTWTQADFVNIAHKLSSTNGIVPWDWIVRLWGSWTSWMYANGSNLLSEGHFDGGDWLWSTFYPNDPAAKGRGGGWKWGEPTANAPGTVEALDFMVQLKNQGLSPSPDVGGGKTLQGLFASGKIGTTIGGGFWAGGLANAGMKPGSFDVQFFPKWKTQRHLFGANGYGLFAQSKKKALGWEFLKSLVRPQGIDALIPNNTSTPTRRSMMTAQRYANTGPAHWQVFYDTLTQHPDTAPIPAPPYYNAMAIALNKWTSQAMSTNDAKSALDGMQRDLESAYASSPR